MADDEGPQGPDFTAGVPASDIGEGQMLAGRVGEEAVLIVRVEGALHAIGAECTHYHGPLAEGLIKDGTVRCPWHHARFCLKTGEALGAPAIDPVACYAVEETGGKVFVRTKLEPPPRPSSPPDAPRRVVIVGAGAAGFAAAEMLRRKGFAGELVMLTADAHAPYDRPNCSKDFLSGDAPPEWMPLREDGFYQAQKIDLRLGTRVESVDREAKTVTLQGGETLAWDALILATGAEPRRPPAFQPSENIFLLRSLADAQALSEAAQKAKVAVVIGASFIGLEVAAALRKRGLEVHVVAPEPVPFETILGAEVGRWVQGVHQAKGVVFHLGTQARRFAGGLVSLDDGTTIAADIVAVGVGVTPRVTLAEGAGLAVDNGVVVDDRLRAAPGIFAVGDIARYPDPVSGQLIRVEHWVHAQRQGQHAARVILGEDRPFTDPPFFWSAHYDQTLNYAGHADSFDPPNTDGSISGYDAAVRYEKDGRLLAVVTLGRDLESLQAEAAFEDGQGPPG
ncbi:MAG TPA: FAD-dependent oxidoreductase [Caulobacteraceae bacterium]|jgi:NADPH-dependent 2,4-dienoyl-CoA reductase/sulfur reductase-like enzyme/nitrite reductase/ring-hydroxylating ferredoxin subunit